MLIEVIIISFLNAYIVYKHLLKILVIIIFAELKLTKACQKLTTSKEILSRLSIVLIEKNSKNTSIKIFSFKNR